MRITVRRNGNVLTAIVQRGGRTFGLEARDLLDLANEVVREPDLNASADAQWILPDDLQRELTDQDRGRWVVTVDRGGRAMLDLDSDPRTIRQLADDTFRGGKPDLVFGVVTCRVGSPLCLRRDPGDGIDLYTSPFAVRQIERVTDPDSTPATPAPPARGVVMVLGDVHGDLGWIKSLLERAHQLGVDTVLSVGDWGIGPFRGDTPGTRFAQKCERIAAKNRVTVYVVPGNHENYDTTAKLLPRADGWLVLTEHVLVAPRGHRWSWGGGVQFGALGGAFSVDYRHRTPGGDWWPASEEVQPVDVERLGSGVLDILVSHDAPTGVPVGPGGLVSTLQISEADLARTQVSRDLLLEAVRRTRPELVLCGHWHQRLSTALPVEVAARDDRPTVGERSLGYVAEARRSRVGIEVLDQEQTDRNWIVLELADLAITEQATAIARARDRADR
jgi:hypothetical protein